MLTSFRHVFTKLFSAFLDVLPIVLVIGVFQTLIIQKPFPNFQETVFGLLLMIFGLFLLIQGLETALFPLGERVAIQFAHKGSVPWILLFGFTLGFAITIAEPALTVIAKKAGEIAAEAQVIKADPEAVSHFVIGLRITIAFSVGLATTLGVLRIIKGWPLVIFIIIGYGLIVIATAFAPEAIVGIAFDSGGITTSTLTVPLITALGIGLASSIRGRSPMLDGFGIIALASLTPILFVMIYGTLVMER